MHVLICSFMFGFYIGARNAYKDYKLYGTFKWHQYMIESLLITMIFYEVLKDLAHTS